MRLSRRLLSLPAIKASFIESGETTVQQKAASVPSTNPSTIITYFFEGASPESRIYKGPYKDNDNELDFGSSRYRSCLQSVPKLALGTLYPWKSSGLNPAA